MRMAKSGFTLLEVIITLGILAFLTVAVTTMMRASFDVRASLAENDQVTHRLSIAMQKISDDLQDAYIISSKDLARLVLDRRTQTIFKIDKAGDVDKLYLTTMTHRARLSSSAESDQTYVAYEMVDDKKNANFKHLYRGEAPFIPSEFKENPPMRILAKYIKSFRIKPWRGDDWSNDRWDSTKGDTKDKLPRMAVVEIEAYARDPSEEAGDTFKEDDTVSMKTVIFLTRSIEYAEIKQRSNSIRWY